MRLTSALGAALALCLGACTPRSPLTEPSPPPEGAPRLVLFLVVDQLRADYLERFRPLLTGGLDRLLREGVVFEDAHQAHNVTATGPGHATLSTGAFPSSHGVVGNSWFDRALGAATYVLDDPEDGSSPRAMLRPSLGDAMKQKWPQSRVFGIGGKDRSAVLTAGSQADAAYWYNRSDGSFRTSTYYAAAPSGTTGWLSDFHAEHRLDELFGTTWEPLLSQEEASAHGVEPLDRGFQERRFPYPLGGLSAHPNSSFYSSIYSTPFIDDHVVAFAERLIEGENLGADGYPDFLGVTLSALDAVGHSNGPHAPETLDTLMRVDRAIGHLLDFLDERIGLDQVVVSLSADHGVGDVPELRLSRNQDGGRLGTDAVQCFQRGGRAISRSFGLEGAHWMPALFYLDRAAIEEAKADFEEVRTAVQTSFEKCPRVTKIFRPEDIDLTFADAPLFAELYRNGYHPDRSADLLYLLEPNTLIGTTTASHGQAHRYDTHVPWLLRLPSAQSSSVHERVRTVDVAPTIAALIGVEMPEADGDNLSHVFSTESSASAATSPASAAASPASAATRPLPEDMEQTG